MAHPDDISADLLAGVASRIGDLVDGNLETHAKLKPQADTVYDAASGSALQLGETLTVWKLTPEAFEALANSKLTGDLSEWTVSTSLLYHQVHLDGSPEGFARSYIEDSTQAPELINVNASAIASKVSQLFNMIEDREQEDRFLAADPVVRLLEIPACRIFALWLYAESERESRVLIINATQTEGEPDQEPFLTSAQFYEVLGKNTPIRDVG